MQTKLTVLEAWTQMQTFRIKSVLGFRAASNNAETPERMEHEEHDKPVFDPASEKTSEADNDFAQPSAQTDQPASKEPRVRFVS